jgi:hypothetical protein
MKFGLPLQKQKRQSKVDPIMEHIRTNGLRCCYKREKGRLFFASKRSSQLSGEVFSIKKENGIMLIYTQMPTFYV